MSPKPPINDRYRVTFRGKQGRAYEVRVDYAKPVLILTGSNGRGGRRRRPGESTCPDRTRYRAGSRLLISDVPGIDVGVTLFSPISGGCRTGPRGGSRIASRD